ncbi:iron chaperone [Glycomyces sp. NPDC048151]|uniref:iron chaperone n=1 Tax=Glycomyces sp. NPDC048151 TaxID=3364002 RepID=UPI0037231E8D
MVQSDAATVDQYLAELPEDRRPVMTAIRDVCRAAMPGFDEVMAYGMPAFERGDDGIAFASQKRYISFYVLRTDVRDAFAERLAGHDMGKGCLRFSRPEKVDLELIRDLAAATAATPGAIC